MIAGHLHGLANLGSPNAGPEKCQSDPYFRSVAAKGRIAAALQAQVWPLIAAGRFRPQIHRRFPLAAAAEAHRLLEGGEVIGKLVLEVAD